MPYEFLISDINRNISQKSIGTDKGLAKIGDCIVNLSYSVAKSIFLSKNSKKVFRTGLKVNRNILSNALKNAGLKHFAKNRANSHDLADTVEAIIAYVWLSKKIKLNEIIDFLNKNLEGDLQVRSLEIISATKAFTNLLNHIKKLLPVK